jgi:hypothetical protein
MILRGAQIQRKGRGKCSLLPNRTLSNNRAELHSSGVPAHTETILHNVWFPVVNSDPKVQHLPRGAGRKLFHTTRARSQAVHRPSV